MAPANSRRATEFDLRFRAAANSFSRKDYSVALSEAIALIDDGYDHAYTLAGAIYERGGNGVMQDYDKALFYYEKSIEAVGAVEGYLALGRLFYFGKGVKQDYRKALEYYSTVEADTDNGVAYLMLGRIYQNGHGAPKDLGKARKYYEKAMAKGYVFGFTYLGLLEHENGKYFRGWSLRLKAAFLSFIISRKDLHDSRLRSC